MSLFLIWGVEQAWASAAEAEHHAPSIDQIWFPLANFLIFTFIIFRYVLPLVRNFLQSRREAVLATIQEAAAKKKHAQAIVDDYKLKLAHLDQEVQSIQALLRSEGDREKAKLLAEGQALAAKIKEDARFLADQEFKLARQRIREEMAAQAEITARQLIERQLSSADQNRLAGDFIESIGQIR